MVAGGEMGPAAIDGPGHPHALLYATHGIVGNTFGGFRRTFKSRTVSLPQRRILSV